MNAIKIENCGIETDTLDALADCPELLHLELVEREEVVQDIEILGNSWQMTAFSGIYKGGNVLDDEALSALAKINPDLEILRINAPLVSDETIKLLTRFKGLKELNLAQTSITSDSLKIIGQLNDLEELVISDTFISDRNLEELASLPKLERLEIDNALITDKGLETISHIPYIYSLSIANKDRRWITDEGILHLSRMDKLRCLDASGSSLSHQGLRALASCESLYYLILNDAGLCDKDLEALPPDKFAPLYLAQNDITDAGVPGIIRAMPGGHCNLSGTRVTSEGIKKLQEADILVLPTFMFEEVTARVNGSPDGVRATNEPISYPMKKTEK
jgi:hypothetical protein